MFVQWKGYTYTDITDNITKVKMWRGRGFYSVFAFYVFLKSRLSNSKVTLKAAAPPCHCWGPVGRGRAVQIQHSLDLLSLLPLLALGPSLGAAGINWSGFPGGAGLSPGCLPQCHDYLQTTLGPAPLTWSQWCCSLHSPAWWPLWPGVWPIRFAFNAILTSLRPCWLSPRHTRGFLLGQPGKQQLDQITTPPRKEPGDQRVLMLVQFLRLGPMSQKHPPPHQVPNSPTSRFLLHSSLQWQELVAFPKPTPASSLPLLQVWAGGSQEPTWAWSGTKGTEEQVQLV